MRLRPIDDDHEAEYWRHQLRLGALISAGVSTVGAVRIVTEWPPADRWWLAPVGLAVVLHVLAVMLPWSKLVRIWQARPILYGCWLAELLLLCGFASHDPASLEIYPGAAMLLVVSAAMVFGPVSVVTLGALSMAGYLGLAAQREQASPTFIISMLMILAIVSGLCAGFAGNRLRQNASRRAAERRTELLLANASDAVLGINPEVGVCYVSPSVHPVLGHEPAWWNGVRLGDMVHPDELPSAREWMANLFEQPAENTARIEVRLRRADGTWLYTEVIGANRTDDPELGAAVLSIRDIDERKALETELSRQALADSLTGLANRALFRDRINHALARNLRASGRITLLLIDVDNFKLVNDSLGHTAGDELLVTVASRLREEVRSCDTLARLGGDEFAVLIEDLNDIEAVQLAERLLIAMRRPIRLATGAVKCTISIGIATAKSGSAPDDPHDSEADQLLRDADLAMYAAKGSGRDKFTVFDPKMHADVLLEAQQRADLERALIAEEFIVHYQPIVDLPARQLTGVEALVRWRHPQHGVVGPAAFIPLAETTGLIVPLGRWVLRQACEQLARWHREWPASQRVRMSVNLSTRQVQYGGLVEDVATILAETGATPSKIVLEITESVLLQDTEATTATLQQLKDLGVRLAIDDFGTGYSSLSYLKRFPVDILKIDRSFVDGMTTDDDDATIAEAVVQLGRALSLQTVAEGIETSEQWSALRSLGCDFGQGYLFAKPVTPDEIEALLSRLGDSL